MKDFLTHFHPNGKEFVVLVLCVGIIVAFLGLKLINVLHRICLKRSQRNFRLRTDQYTRRLAAEQAKQRENQRFMGDGGKY